MAEETILTWNATNWITVLLMTVIGFALLSLASQLFRNWNTSRNASVASGG